MTGLPLPRSKLTTMADAFGSWQPMRHARIRTSPVAPLSATSTWLSKNVPDGGAERTDGTTLRQP